MRKRNVWSRLAWTLFLSFHLTGNVTLAQEKPDAGLGKIDKGFQLTDGDRVVFLGNSLFENEMRYGYLELALTTRWPNAAVTFRNLGWNGDTVWGEARTYISPPSGYPLLVQQLAKAAPTVVFIAYGTIESEKGQAGLPRFKEGLNALLDEIERLGAKPVLLSPAPVLNADVYSDIAYSNAELERYGASIKEIAARRNATFIDIFHPLLQKNKQIKLSKNGIHLNEYGYYYLANVIESGLGLESREASAIIDVSTATTNADTSLKILETGKKKESLTFSVDPHYLPLPSPEATNGRADGGDMLAVKGLRKGYYSLRVDGAQVATASARKWAEGMPITQGPYLDQSNQLRELILKKNELFFHQYRPQNRTYILGFRSHEQGRHAAGLKDLSIIITWLEGQIDLQRVPEAKVFQLTKINE